MESTETIRVIEGTAVFRFGYTIQTTVGSYLKDNVRLDKVYISIASPEAKVCEIFAIEVPDVIQRLARTKTSSDSTVRVGHIEFGLNVDHTWLTASGTPTRLFRLDSTRLDFVIRPMCNLRTGEIVAIGQFAMSNPKFDAVLLGYTAVTELSENPLT